MMECSFIELLVRISLLIQGQLPGSRGAYQVSAEPHGKHTFSQVGQIQLLWHKCWTYWQKCKLE